MDWPFRFFVGAMGLSLVASAGVLIERVDHGDVSTAALAMILQLIAAALVFVSLRRDSSGSLASRVASAAAGAALGIALVHGGLRLLPSGWTRGLVESPAQLINDIVAAGSAVLLVGSLATRSALRRGVLVAVVFGGLALYRFTARAWHVDASTFTDMTVQQFVAAEVVAIASGLLVLDFLSPSPGG